MRDPRRARLARARRRRASSDEQADFHRIMLDGIERLDHGINQVFDAGLFEVHRADDPSEDVPLGLLLVDAAESVLVGYRLAGEVVRFAVAPCAVRARRVDRGMIFGNLIDDAAKYGGAEPHVEVTMTSGARGLKGRHSVGGCRAPIYNAMSLESVEEPVAFMREFQERNA